MDLKEIVTSSIKNKTNIENINESTVLTDLGLDSLDLVDIALEIEDKLNLNFTSNELTKIVTIKDVISLIERKTK